MMRSITNCMIGGFPPVMALSAGLLCALQAGCQSERMAAQGNGFRDAVLKTYDDQLWDSLVRAKQNRLFVLLNYTELFGQDSEQVGAGAGGGKFVPVGGAENGWLVAGGAQRTGVLNFKATPVANDRVINSVVEFADQYVHVSSAKPQSCHEYRLRDGKYYYVAVQDAPAFLDLALHASFPLDDTAALLDFYPISITAITPETSKGPQTRNKPEVVRFTFSAPVPNGEGVMSTPDGAFELRPVPDRIAGEGTRELLVTWRSDYQPRDPNALKGTPVRFFSTNYPPGAKSPAQQNTELLEKVINSVDRLGAAS